MEMAAPDKRIVILRDALPSLFTVECLASMLLGLYSVLIDVRDFKKPIAEAIEAAATGLPHAAVSALTPVLGGVLRRVAAGHGEPLARGKNSWMIVELDELIGKEGRSPHRFEERIVMLESLRDFFAERLYQHGQV
jgi:hypothetical protein